MKSYRTFISELYNAPLLSVDKHKADINNEETLNELNRNISVALSKDFSNVGEALSSVKKILSMYSIELPQINLTDKSSGKISVDVSMFSSSGENHKTVTKPFGEKNENHKFVFIYKLVDGKYDVHAEVLRK